MSSCTSDDLATEAPQPKVNNTVTLTTTISLDGSAQTRALTSAGVKTFAKDDKIALIYTTSNGETVNIVSDPITAENIFDDGKKAKVIFDGLSGNPEADQDARLIYPAAMAKTTIDASAKINDDNTIDFSKLAVQDGTLASLADNLDLCTWDGQLNELQPEFDTSKLNFDNMPNLTNRLTIGEFTIKDGGGANITDNFDLLTINDGVNTYRVNGGNGFSSSAPIYVAMIPVSGKDITFSAIKTTQTTAYVKTVTGKTLNAGNMYPINLTMTQEAVNLAAIDTDFEAQDGDILLGTLGTNVKISIAAGATVTLNDVNINMKDDGTAKWDTGSHAGITCLGDATIILEGTNKVQGFASNYPGIQVAHNDSGEEFTLTINGDGSLEATGTYNGAGIGSARNAICGNITISGGTIATQGVNFGAGIGTGYKGQCGDITISGGSIEAKGNLGIGCTRDGSCGNITIIGGSIKAVSKNGNVGIGSGESINQNSVCGNITISGGTVTVTGIIGSGFGNNTFISKCGNITISGGTVTATSSSSRCPGIGSSGNFTKSLSECGDITITTDITMVVSTRGELAPFGIGKGYGSFSYCGKIKFGEATVYSGDNTSTNPVTSGSWSPNPIAIGNYGGLSFSISTKTNTDDTWTLSPYNE